MAKRPPSGRCVHCLKESLELTWDHVFPQAWYPDTTPANLEKWKIPACLECNQLHSKSEGDLLVNLAMCIDPDDRFRAGLLREGFAQLARPTVVINGMQYFARRDENQFFLECSRAKRYRDRRSILDSARFLSSGCRSKWRSL